MLAFSPLHVLDEHSPLNGLEFEQLRAEEAEIVVTIEVPNEVSGQAVFARTAYGFDHVLYNHRFVDIIDAVPNG